MNPFLWLFKARKGQTVGGKYKKRTATGNPEHPWRYEYEKPKSVHELIGPAEHKAIVQQYLKRSGYGQKAMREAKEHPEKFHAWKQGFAAALKEANNHVSRAKEHVERMRTMSHADSVSYLDGLDKETLQHVSEVAGLKKHGAKGIITFKVPHHQKGKWDWISAFKGTEPKQPPQKRNTPTAGDTGADHYKSPDALSAHLDKLFWSVDPKTGDKSTSRWLNNALWRTEEDGRQDVAIEAALELLAKQKNGKLAKVPRDKFNGFVRAVLNFTAQNAARKQNHDVVSDFHATEEVTPDSRKTPEEDFVGGDTRSALERKVQSALLDDTDRKIHEMLLSGKKQDEIGHAIGMSRQSVNKRLMQIKQRARDSVVKTFFLRLFGLAA